MQKNSLVLIKSAVKNSRKKNPKEVITYENVVDEVVEEVVNPTEVTLETVSEEVNETVEEAENN